MGDGRHQTPIKTDLRSSMLLTKEKLEVEDETPVWVFHCPHCGMSIAEDELDSDSDEEEWKTSSLSMTPGQHRFYDSW